MRLFLDIPGAAPADLARGVAAAQAILDMYGVTPEQGASSRWKVEHAHEPYYSLEDGESLEPTMEDEKVAAIWYRAEAAAVKACGKDPAPYDPDDHPGPLGCSRD
ncbi:hypothetical protein GGQ99_001258 [Aminobacter niigataensis]|uniref:Uncharacterized protein n=1 Tax=Aminobacter niigataensis TaxID=83265 RepID=A0ABR6KYN6_9HYPH|nr:hypothetical protein [Aminobacter niigataensis]MBB4649536.1 hypothetical protein [Aminobacter niigataensis]